MDDDSNEKKFNEKRKTIISNATMTAIIIITNEIEGYMRQYLDKGEDEALRWIQKAAEQGHVAAQNTLGAMYLEGEGVSKDYEEAMKWIKKAAEQGDVVEQHRIGELSEAVLEKRAALLLTTADGCVSGEPFRLSRLAISQQ